MTDPRAEATDTLAEGISPSRNDGVTIPLTICTVCGRAFRPVGRRRFCSDACRQTAWRHRHSNPASVPPLPDGAPRPGASDGFGSRSFRSATVYECPSCGTRYLGEQRCPDCRLFCRRVGLGGHCPHCDEPVAVGDLVADEGR
jgi:hypothetical protein